MPSHLIAQVLITAFLSLPLLSVSAESVTDGLVGIDDSEYIQMSAADLLSSMDGDRTIEEEAVLVCAFAAKILLREKHQKFTDDDGLMAEGNLRNVVSRAADLEGLIRNEADAVQQGLRIALLSGVVRAKGVIAKELTGQSDEPFVPTLKLIEEIGMTELPGGQSAKLLDGLAVVSGLAGNEQYDSIVIRWLEVNEDLDDGSVAII